MGHTHCTMAVVGHCRDEPGTPGGDRSKVKRYGEVKGGYAEVKGGYGEVKGGYGEVKGGYEKSKVDMGRSKVDMGRSKVDMGGQRWVSIWSLILSFCGVSYNLSTTICIPHFEIVLLILLLRFGEEPHIYDMYLVSVSHQVSTTGILKIVLTVERVRAVFL